LNDNVEITRSDDFQKILEITRSLVAAADVDQLLRLIADRAIELLQAERATVFLYDAAAGELVSRVAHGEKDLRVPADRGVAGAVVASCRTINVPDAYADDRFNPEVDRKTGFRTRNILSVPLLDYECSLVGVLQVLNKNCTTGVPPVIPAERMTGETPVLQKTAFDEYDILLAESLAAQAGVAIQRHRLIGHYLQKLEMERAMKIAQEIQAGLLPKENPSIEGFDVAGFCEPADQTGGDTYDFMPLPGGRWMIVVADATGHGIGPALVIAETRAMLRATCLHDPDVSRVLTTVNNLLTADLADSRFVTCFLGLLNPAACEMTYSSAGHGPMLFYNRRDGRFASVPANTVPLGIMQDPPTDQAARHPLACGDFAVITTDGFFEAANETGEEFGLERMTALLHRDRDLSASQMIQNLHQAVHEFTGQKVHADDLTAVIVKRI
jgi:phosphoserine phosphatase